MFSFYRKKLSTENIKTSLVKFGFLVILAIIFTTSIGILFSTQTNAASLSFPQNADKNVQKLLLHRFLGYCIKNAPLSGGILIDNGGRITGNTPANSGDWFLSKTKTLSPYFEDTRFNVYKGSEHGYLRTAGIGDCGDEATIKLAIDSLGVSGVTILCNIGLVRSDGSPCVEGNGDFRHANNSKTGSTDSYNSFMNKYPEPSLDDNGWYWFYRKVFNWTCGYGKMSSPVEKATADGSADYGYALTYLTDSGPSYSETKYFIGLEKKGTTVNTRLGTGGDGTSVERSCAQIADHINDYGAKEASRIATLASTSPDQFNDIIAAPSEGDADSNAPNSDKSSCTIEQIGWIVCPILTFTSGVVDAAYGFVDGLLKVQPLMTTGATVGVYDGWVVMRNIANVAFVIVFLFIIFSQLTGLGVSNYGVKKMLPRLVIAALLVNVSYWICAIAVDISNILGNSMIGIFNSIEDSIPSKEGLSIADTGNGWLGLTGAVLTMAAAGAITYWVGLAALIPALLAAVLAILTVFLVLTLRQALIILLIVIAPIAFVGYILPNTEEWFSRWRKLLMTLLLMYPIIAAIFGASALASTIVMNSSSNMTIQIMGAAIAIVPLAITPIVMKTAGGILNRFAGIVNNAERGPVDRMKRAGEKWGGDRRNLRNAKALQGQKQFGRGSFVKWRARRAAIASGRQSEANRANTDYIADKIQTSDNFKNAVAGGGVLRGKASEGDLSRAEASAINSKQKLELEEVSAATAIIKDANLTLEQTQELAMKGSVDIRDSGGNITKTIRGDALQTAAIQKQFKTGDIGLTDQLIMNSGAKTESGADKFNLSQRQAIAEGAQSLAGKVKYYGGATGDMIAQGQIQNEAQLNDAVKVAMETGKFSELDIANQDKDSLTRIAQVAARSDTDNSKLVEAAIKLQANDQIYPTVEGRKRERIDAIVQGVAFGEQTTPSSTASPSAQTLVISHSAQDAHAAARELNTPKEPGPPRPPQ